MAAKYKVLLLLTVVLLYLLYLFVKLRECQVQFSPHNALCKLQTGDCWLIDISILTSRTKQETTLKWRMIYGQYTTILNDIGAYTGTFYVLRKYFR